MKGVVVFVPFSRAIPILFDEGEHLIVAPGHNRG